MRGWKKKASELVQRIKDYFDAPNRLFSLFIFCILVLFIIFEFYYSYPFRIDNESAMYFLSALVQSQAAILAIVITLTLIAVQLASSHYSPRVIDIFKKDLAIWWFLCFYGFSIFFGLCILMMMQVIQNGDIVIPIGLNRYSFHISLEYWIYAAYWIAIITFAALFFYMKNVLHLLKPSTIIKKLSDNITNEKISKHIKSLEEHKKDRTKPIEDDPVQPIIDIIHGSVMRYDIATTSIGIDTIGDRAIEIIELDEWGDNLSEHFCAHLKQIGKLAAKNTNEVSAIEVVKSLGTLGVLIVEKKIKHPIESICPILSTIRYLGEFAAEKKLESVADQAARSLGDVGRAAVAVVTRPATENEGDIVGVALKSAEFLFYIGETASKNELDGVIRTSANSILFLGTDAQGKGLGGVALQTAWHLAKLTILSEEIVVSNVIRMYPFFESDAASQKFKELYEQRLEKLRTQKPN